MEYSKEILHHLKRNQDANGEDSLYFCAYFKIPTAVMSGLQLLIDRGLIERRQTYGIYYGYFLTDAGRKELEKETFCEAGSL